MAEVPDYEKYPISEEELGKRYKNWVDSLLLQMLMLYRIGREVGGDRFIKRLKDEYYKSGQKMANTWLRITGTKLEDYTDCKVLLKLQDMFDDSLANFWDGYRENSPKAFEKDIFTCPAAKRFSREPEICEVIISEAMRGMYEALNPKFKFTGFSKLIPKGDKVCRLRVEMQE
jgi:hypothetical protein